MTFDDAVQLARDCMDHYSRITVVAIGKFVPADQLATATDWGVSVVADGTRMMVLWDRGDVLPFTDFEKPKAKAAKSKKARRQETVDQFLF